MRVTWVGVLFSDWAASSPPNPPPTMTTRCSGVPSDMNDASWCVDEVAFYERRLQKAGKHSASIAGATHQNSCNPTGRANDATVIATCPATNTAARANRLAA